MPKLSESVSSGTCSLCQNRKYLLQIDLVVANGPQKWLWATLIFDYSGLNGDTKYLWSFSILDAEKINGMLIKTSEVLSWLYRIYVNHKSFVTHLTLQEMLPNHSRSDINRDHSLYF